jgi:protein-disulfide isomerase-like protein with CxxC motif
MRRIAVLCLRPDDVAASDRNALIPRCSPCRLAGESLALVLPAQTPACRTISCNGPRPVTSGASLAACEDGAMIDVTHFTDPGCPWAYSASPALATLSWRYGEQLRWTLVTIGLAEDAELYAKRGYTPLRGAIGYMAFRRFAMPFQVTPKPRLSATSPACRAIVATRLTAPELEYTVFRALQFAQFTTAAVFEQPDTLRAALDGIDGLDGAAIVAAIDDPEVLAAYEADRARARTAAGSPTEFQGRAFNSDGAVRYTAPSLIFESDDGRRLEAGGFQPLEAYDVVVANLDPTLMRRQPAEDPVEALAAFPYALATAEVAAIMAPHLTPPDIERTERALITAAVEGRAQRQPIGDGALWSVGSNGS